MNKNESIEMVLEYHDRTKHHPRAHANSLGYMDWPNQPDPFRSFANTEIIELPHPELKATPTFDRLYGPLLEPAAMDLASIGHFFYHSLALSAWKQVGLSEPWSLRINPSSGALHPTEGYLVCGPTPGLAESAGVYHYQPYYHRLEKRAELSLKEWGRLSEGFPEATVFVGLTSIYWRESWKYGERAFRYCNHDVGHAIGCLAYAARMSGWSLKRLPGVADAELSRLIGTDAQAGIEAEHADCLLALSSKPPGTANIQDWSCRIPEVEPLGKPNLLSKGHHPWPIIDEVSKATRQLGPDSGAEVEPVSGIDAYLDRGQSAEQIIRQRRSARDMDGKTAISLDDFVRILQRLKPESFLFESLNAEPAVSLALFVNRVDGLVPGLYLLPRTVDLERDLRKALSPDFTWDTPEGVPDNLGLLRLFAGDVKDAARVISCNQDIASDGAFAVGMIARFEETMKNRGASAYPRLFWETGLIGQELYLEAEAAGISGTGIGCFLDDLMHQLLGISDHNWQSLYHFTVGKPLDDERLKTIAPYDHLSKA